MTKKKTYLEKLGLEPVKKLNKKICYERVQTLEDLLETDKLSGKLKAQAKYYANWYWWMYENGGTRGTTSKKQKAA